MGVISLIEVSSAPGSLHEKVMKVFETRDEAIKWLRNCGYKFNDNVKCWEHSKDEDYFVWTYVKVRED